MFVFSSRKKNEGENQIIYGTWKVHEGLCPLGEIPYWSRETVWGRKFSSCEVLLTDLNCHNPSALGVREERKIMCEGVKSEEQFWGKIGSTGKVKTEQDFSVFISYYPAPFLLKYMKWIFPKLSLFCSRH